MHLKAQLERPVEVVVFLAAVMAAINLLCLMKKVMFRVQDLLYDH